MSLIIDSREKSTLTDLVIEKCKKMNISYSKEWIEVGDYIIGDVCFEAKSTHDFLSSIISKRLWTQLDNMDRCFKTNIVIIYGTLNDAFKYIKYSPKNKLPIKRKIQLLTNKFYGGIGRIALDTDIKPIWVLTESNASSIICSVVKMQPIDRPAIKPQLFKRITTDDIRVDMLCGIKGISEKKAKSLLKEHGSLMEIGDSNSNELCKSDGIGNTTAGRILDIFNSEKKVMQ
jgi:ERCC4-type nuclease